MTSKDSDDFDLADFTGDSITHPKGSRLDRQFARIQADGKDISCISGTVNEALKNIREHGTSSFVIYGEPQSGKTEMMIALTAALLDSGVKIIVILTNDSIQLLEQNLTRFQESGLDPAPKNFSEILDPTVRIPGREWVIFAKKNQSDLNKLLGKISSYPNRIIIDDEADYASPNGRVNKAQKTKINHLVEKLIGTDGIYIGVTATPARLDLNATFDNDNDRWVDFPAHSFYTGQDVFFPTTEQGIKQRKYRLELMPTVRDNKKYLRKALLSFLANVAFLNISKKRPENYSMLIHTSGKRADHSEDYKTVSEIFGILADSNSPKFNKMAEELFNLAKSRYGSSARDVTKFVIQSINQNNIVIMNSNSDRQQSSYKKATNPTTLFTIAIGGNIVSRGVTFDNLLTMFFTRDAAHKIQQDTYIQRARMFGSREKYLEWFELYIPKDLYSDWLKCFVFHKLSLSGIRSSLGAPLWLEDNRVRPATPASIKRAAVQWQSGEMYWEIFDLTDAIKTIVGDGGNGIGNLRTLATTLGGDSLPDYVLEFIENFSPNGDASVALHPTHEILPSYKSADAKNITRAKGFIGAGEMEPTKYPQAIHHVKIFANQDGKARVYYKYSPDRGLAFISRVK